MVGLRGSGKGAMAPHTDRLCFSHGRAVAAGGGGGRGVWGLGGAWRAGDGWVGLVGSGSAA